MRECNENVLSGNNSEQGCGIDLGLNKASLLAARQGREPMRSIVKASCGPGGTQEKRQKESNSAVKPSTLERHAIRRGTVK